MDTLFKKLMVYSGEDVYPMHMPGHKRNIQIMKEFNPYEIDITEIDGFDNLHHAQGVILNLIERVQRLYQSEKSFLLINGSTVGLLAGISACVDKGDRVIVARNSHKAVYNAMILNELNPVYIYPQTDGIYGIHGGISPEKVEELLISYPDTKLVVITSPTYEGVISDIGEIAGICHAHNVPLLVDEAHGAHLGFHKDFPGNSIQAGADVVIHSIHKTLPAFTQTALLHVNSELVSTQRIATFLGIYETSSPSYLLMAGIDQCIQLLEEKKDELFTAYQKNLNWFYEMVSGLCRLSFMKESDYSKEQKAICNMYAWDPSKIVISVKNTDMTGSQLSELLRSKYKIELEMSSMDYALAMTSICDTKDGFKRLAEALIEIDQNLSKDTKESKYYCEARENNQMDIQPVMAYKPYQAFLYEREEICLSKAAGRCAADNIMIYPPGIPLVVQGEVISTKIIEHIRNAYQIGLEIIGVTVTKEDVESLMVHVIQADDR